MALTRADTIEQLESEWTTLEAFVRGISDADMDRPTRCEEWTVRGVTAHIVGGVLDVAGGTVGTRTGHQDVEDRPTHSPSQTEAELQQTTQTAVKPRTHIHARKWTKPSPRTDRTAPQAAKD